jgi:aryl-phospho-beta-D-glucosidase BglC (GH1 family)
MIRLDDYTKLSGNDISPMNFINMDVEGYEMEVLKGATKTLKHVDYIICEVSSEERYVGQALEPEITEYLKKKGFDLIASDWGGVNWGDQLYAKRDRYYIDKNSPLNIIR